jgi:hypothetical protein
MPRKIRVEYPGAIYHLMSRGDRNEDIYHNDVDRQDFLKTLGENGVAGACLLPDVSHSSEEVVDGSPPYRQVPKSTKIFPPTFPKTIFRVGAYSGAIRTVIPKGAGQCSD